MVRHKILLQVFFVFTVFLNHASLNKAEEGGVARSFADAKSGFHPSLRHRHLRSATKERHQNDEEKKKHNNDFCPVPPPPSPPPHPKPAYRRKAVNAHKDGKTCHHFHHVQGHSEAMKHACSPHVPPPPPPPPPPKKHDHKKTKEGKHHQKANHIETENEKPSSPNPKWTRGESGYKLVKSYSGTSFFDEMSFFTQGDPSGGMIEYVDKQTAINEGLIWSKNNNAFMRIGWGQGGVQRSVRVSTEDTFTTGIFILDAYHMPTGCGVWPAFWTTPADPQGGWPNGGEIDIIEGVHYFSRNMYSIHAPSSCMMSQPVEMLGVLAMPDTNLNHNCDPWKTDDQGCGVKSQNDGDYGQDYNLGGGGVHALVWDASSGIQMYFFPRNKIPGDIKAGNPNPSGWGKAMASYPANGCTPDDYFQEHSAVFSNTVCGTWAGSYDVWNSVGGGQYASCASITGQSSCYQHSLSGMDLSTAYWEISSLKIYQLNRRK